jgi:hypothetical protein
MHQLCFQGSTKTWFLQLKMHSVSGWGLCSAVDGVASACAVPFLLVKIRTIVTSYYCDNCIKYVSVLLVL